jgi:alkylated DNA repair dioxygenase AlkB
MKGSSTLSLSVCGFPFLLPPLMISSPLFLVVLIVLMNGISSRSAAVAAWATANAGGGDKRDESSSFSTSNTISRSAQQLVRELQTNSHTPSQVLHRVGRHVSPSIDRDGSLSRLVLVRLAKQWVTIDNHRRQRQEERRHTTELPLSQMEEMSEEDKRTLSSVIASLAEANLKSSTAIVDDDACDNVVEGTKALSVLLRCLSNSNIITSADDKMVQALQHFWEQNDGRLSSCLRPHQLSGLNWAMDNFRVIHRNDSKHLSSLNSSLLPSKLRAAYHELNLPFRVLPGFVSDMHQLSLQDLVQQVDFSVDDIRTTSNQVVKERRKTAWQGDEGVAPFSYSSKAMPRQPWSPTVQMARDALSQELNQYYDGCLLNLYHDGGSGMRYHIDPDQGTLWDYETAVVSIGATRRFAFREITPSTAPVSASLMSRAKNKREKSISNIGSNNNNNSMESQRQSSSIVHSFVVMHGDVTLMYNDCQQRFQHTVKKAEDRNDMTARASLVFKRTLNR